MWKEKYNKANPNPRTWNKNHKANEKEGKQVGEEIFYWNTQPSSCMLLKTTKNKGGASILSDNSPISFCS